jgi:hypothetical protein
MCHFTCAYTQFYRILPRRPCDAALPTSNYDNAAPTARGFEPLRAEPNGFLVHHLNHSVTLSLASSSIFIISGLLSLGCRRIKSFFEGRESGFPCIVVRSHRGQTYQGAAQSPCADKLRLLPKRFGEFLNISPLLIGPVAQWIRHRPTEPGIAGSSPAGVILWHCFLGLMCFVHT